MLALDTRGASLIPRSSAQIKKLLNDGLGVPRIAEHRRSRTTLPHILHCFNTPELDAKKGRCPANRHHIRLNAQDGQKRLEKVIIYSGVMVLLQRDSATFVNEGRITNEARIDSIDHLAVIPFEGGRTIGIQCSESSDL